MLTSFFAGAFMGYAIQVLAPESEHPNGIACICGGLGGIALAAAIIFGLP